MAKINLSTILQTAYQKFAGRLFAPVDVKMVHQVPVIQPVFIVGHMGCDGENYPYSDEAGMINVRHGTPSAKLVTKELTAAGATNLTITFTDGIRLNSAFMFPEVGDGTKYTMSVLDSSGNEICILDMENNAAMSSSWSFLQYPMGNAKKGQPDPANRAGVNGGAPIIIPPGWKLYFNCSGGTDTDMDYAYVGEKLV